MKIDRNGRHWKNKTTMEDQIKLFAYGTLRTSQPESALLQDKLLDSKPARILGKLYQLQEGYPILHVPSESILGLASDFLLADWNLISEKAVHPTPVEAAPFKWIEGELLSFPLEDDVLNAMDAWEGFAPGKNTFYQRVLTQAYTEDDQVQRCWAYVCLSEPKAPTVPIDGNSWVRPKGLKY